MSRAQKELHIVSNLYWEATDIHTVDATQFKYAYWMKSKKKYYAGQMSSFVNEIVE